MANSRQGSIHLFRVVGIDVFLHWTWFVVALIEIEYLRNRYTSIVWCLLEYLSLFVIVLLHEFGHALACRQVGGTSDQIMLWPLGGVAYVRPPQRPGANLWSIAAGPLVNVALLPILFGALTVVQHLGWAQTRPDAYHWVAMVLYIDAGLLAFNLLPVFPLDGGQILQSLLWFFMGRARSLATATVIGFIGAAGFVLVALWLRSVWLVIIAGYMLMNCWKGMKGALALMRIEKIPRRDGFACPACGSKPPLGPRWRCSNCGSLFDTFSSGAICPQCQINHRETMCIDCGTRSPMENWTTGAALPADSVHGPSPVAP